MSTRFAIVALVIAAVGLYGTVAYGVTQRVREFGIRMACGASTRDIVRLVVAQGTRLTLTGVAIGVIATLGVAGAIRHLLFSINPIDVPSFAGAIAILTAVALLASYIPGRRAAATDPTNALRAD